MGKEEQKPIIYIRIYIYVYIESVFSKHNMLLIYLKIQIAKFSQLVGGKVSHKGGGKKCRDRDGDGDRDKECSRII